eukprot:8447512-Alexandrium_andersonii.AAC.1
MSASLVGSEMCIRDSQVGHDGRTPCERSFGKPCRGESLDFRELVRDLAPVSYTHLTLADDM